MGNSTGKLTVLRRWTQSEEYSNLEDKIQESSLNHFPLDVLKTITGDFSEKQELGRDQFGVVYKGVLQDGRAIAVKKLSETHLDDDQFQKEVTYIFNLKHKNIVKLVGYCAESQSEVAAIDGKYAADQVRKRLLCYEYTNNKRLDKHISSIPTSAETNRLEWHIRYKIISGICRGLHYLHMECPCEIAHMDLKPQNILLDESMEPTIADFGMLRLFDCQLSETFKETGGATVGYMAPEYLANGLVSAKADIFSLGVIIIELMTGCRDYPSTEESYEHFVENVVARWRKSLEAAGSRYRLLEYYVEQVKMCILTGLMCVNAEPNKRPNARDILERINEADVMKMNKGSMQQLVHFDVGFMSSDLEDLLGTAAEVFGKGTNMTAYWRMLENGTVVAVKRFRYTTMDQKDFKAELAVLVKIRHPNLVLPIACYVSQDVRLIVIDYMVMGSLSAILHAHSRRTPANWAKRMEIAKGIARGLTCLHDDMGIIHGNLTAKNVLLDKDYHPKIADFGLFRLLTPAEAANYNISAAAPELGDYYAPEMSSPTNASTKTDVYSLGIIILELLTRLLPSSINLPRWVRSVNREEWSSEVFDQELFRNQDARTTGDQLEATLMLAIQCVDPSPSARPEAREVLWKLEKICPGRKNADGVPEQEQKPLDNREMKFKLPLRYVRDITNNFSPQRKLGSGGFGVVYKGIDTKSGAVIAVKRLKQILGEQNKQFKNEVNHLARLNHDNVVKLIGYCDGTEVIPVYDDYQQKYVMAQVQEKVLCYEYLPNGSLDNISFNESLGHDWQDRCKIITGICQGLYYIHKRLIVHMDLKPSNILLDDRMLPKIADFGLSRIFSEEQTRTCTLNLMGSIGYMAPEYCNRGEISTKSDIYSLGILILEVATGNKNQKVLSNKSGELFIESVRKHWSRMSHIASKHPSLGKECLQQVHRCIEIGLRCVETDQERRPSAREVWLHMQDIGLPMQGVLSVTVISGEDLTAKDTNGKSNPYVTLYLEKTKQTWSQTRVVKESLNPVWNQTFDFVVEDGLHDMLILEVYHNGTFHRGYMGRCILTMTNVLLEGEYQSLVLEGAKSGKLNLHLHWTPYRSNRA